MNQVFSSGFLPREVVGKLDFEMIERGCEVGAFRGEVGMCNLGEARADYAVEGTRIEQPRPSSECRKFVAGVRRRFVRLNPWRRSRCRS